MEKVSMIGIDLAKNWFQLHGAAADGSVVFRKKLVRHKVLDFLASQPNCPVAMCRVSYYSVMSRAVFPTFPARSVSV